jgi:putative endopeptidase
MTSKINDNFYNYVNLDWINNNKLPDDKSILDQYYILQEKIDKNLMKYLDNVKNNNLKILWDKGNKLNNNIQPQNQNIINQILQQIDDVKSTYDLGKLYIDLIDQFNINGPILFIIDTELNNSDKNLLLIQTGGLSLPVKEYYFKDIYIKERKSFKKFIKEYTDLFNLNLTKKQIDLLYFIEKKIAGKTYTLSEQINPTIGNDIKTIKQIEKDYKNLKWIHYFFDKYNIKPNKIMVSNINFLKYMNKMFNENFLDNLKLYFKFKFISSINSFVSLKINDCWLNFYEKTLNGVKKLQSLKKRVFQNINEQIGQELGLVWVKKNFNNKIKNDIKNIFNYVKKSFYHSLLNNEWISKTTKKKAIKKLFKIRIEIGYPNKKGLLNYSKLKLSNDDTYLESNIKINSYNNLLKNNELYKKTNKNQWIMHPHKVNAYYHQTFTKVVIPAGLLQEPFYYKNNNMVGSNFGGIGMIIAHEIIHGFDDKGKFFDLNGNLNNWWLDKDTKNYNKKVDKLKEQYNKYNVNTSLTIGESIADLGGLKFSVLALEKYLDKNKENKGNKENQEQFKKFFINFAYIWAEVINKKYIKYLAETDLHPLSIYRVNVSIKNIDKFYEVFNIKDGKIYIPANERVNIW